MTFPELARRDMVWPRPEDEKAANKRGAGKGGLAVMWRAGRAWPALPDAERYAFTSQYRTG